MLTHPLALLLTSPGPDNILLAMFLVFGSAKLLAELFERFHQPGIAGEILAGVLLGPHVLHWVQPGHVLEALADLGVMFLLFRVGLEIKSSDLKRAGGTALAVAALGVLIPFPVGWAIMNFLGAPPMEAVFVGAAMVATSVGITAQVLASKGLLNQTASQVILAAAVIDDVLGLIVLAVVSSVAKGSINVVELILTAAAAIAFTVVAAAWGAPSMKRLIPKMQNRLRAGEVQFNLAILVLFGLALLAVFAGVAAIIGAFLAGMALSESLDRRVHHLAQGVAELLTPFFLAGIGLYLDLSVFANAEALLVCGLILVAAVLSKVLGGGLGALRMGWRNALRVGVGMTPRGEVGMVVAQIGLGLGAVSVETYGIVVFMAVATTLLAPALLNLTFRTPQRTEDGSRMAAELI